MSELNIKTTALIWQGYESCDYANYHAVQSWVSVESLLKFLHNVVDNIPTIDMGSIDFRDSQRALVDDLEQLLLKQPKQVSRTEVACNSSKPTTGDP